MRVIYFLAVFIILVSSCTARPVEPSRASRHTIDTLFQQNILVLQSEVDSICKARYQIIYAAAVDSLMAVRKLEMNILVQ